MVGNEINIASRVANNSAYISDNVRFALLIAIVIANECLIRNDAIDVYKRQEQSMRGYDINPLYRYFSKVAGKEEAGRLFHVYKCPFGHIHQTRREVPGSTCSGVSGAFFS